MEAVNASLFSEIHATSKRVEELMAQMGEKSAQATTLAAVRESLLRDLQQQQQEMQRAAENTSELMHELEQEKRRHVSDVEGLNSRLRTLQSEADSVRIKLRVAEEEIERLRSQLQSTKVRLPCCPRSMADRICSS